MARGGRLTQASCVSASGVRFLGAYKPLRREECLELSSAPASNYEGATLNDRIQKLERRLRIQSVVLGLVALCGVAIAAAPGNETITAQSIILRHPNGGSPITLRAAPDVSGIWIGDGQESSKNSVAIFNNKDSAVVGTYGGKNQSLNACLASTTTSGPVLQMASQDGSIALGPNNWHPQAKKMDGFTEVRFYPPNLTNQ